MALVWNPWGVAGLVAVALAATLAYLISWAVPASARTRSLALLLALEGVLVAVCTSGVSLMVDGEPEFVWTQRAHAAVVLALPWVYLAFLGVTLDTPLVRPFRGRVALVALAVIGISLQAAPYVWPDRFIMGTMRPWFAPWAMMPGPWFMLALKFFGLVSAFGLIAAFDAWRRARTEIAKRRARAYAIAFGVRDAWWVLLLFVLAPTMDLQSVRWGVVWTQSMPLATIVFLGLLGHAVLRTQLFDIDLRIKRSIKHSAIAAVFIGVFFVVRETTEQTLGEWMGSTYVGIGAAALLFAFMAPLERMARNVADRTMPHVQSSAEYLADRKLHVYRAALEGAWVDAAVTPRERRILDRLRAELGIGDDEAFAVERDVVRQLGRPA